MRILAVLLVVLVGISSTATILAADEDPAARVLSRYLEASGGLDEINNLPGLSASIQLTAYNYQYALHLNSDGRFRVDAPNRVTVFDNEKYWQTSYGLVAELPEDQLDDYRQNTIRGIFFHDLIDADGNPVAVEYGGTSTQRGQDYELLKTSAPDGAKRTYYFNTETGLLDKIIELEPDEEYRERKNILRFADYTKVGDLTLFMKSEGVCVTTGDFFDPSSQYSDVDVSGTFEEGTFSIPEPEVSPATFVDGAIKGEVIGMSQVGSLITNITARELEYLSVAEGDTLVANVKGHESRFYFIENISDAPDLGPGDYLAIYNNGPALWLVKAYLGMTSDHEYAIGDAVELTKAVTP